MVYGVDIKEKQAAPTPTEPAGADPWLTSADPRASPPGLGPETSRDANWAASGAAWASPDAAWPPPGGDIDAFGKGKGKSKGKGYGERPPMDG